MHQNICGQSKMHQTKVVQTKMFQKHVTMSICPYCKHNDQDVVNCILKNDKTVKNNQVLCSEHAKQ